MICIIVPSQFPSQICSPIVNNKMSSSTPSLSPSSTSPPSFSPDLSLQSTQEVDQPKNEAILATPQINHENLFETIAKLAGIDGPIEEGEEEEKAMEMEENGQQKEMQNLAEQQMNGSQKLVETPQQPAAGGSSSSSSSSSSRRKNGNPTRISGGDGGEECKIIGKNEEKVKNEPKEGEVEDEESSQNEEQMEEGEAEGKNGTNRNSQASAHLANNHQFGLQFPPPFPAFGGFGQQQQQSLELMINNDEQMQQQRRLYAQLMQQGPQQNCSQAQMQQGQMLAMQRQLHRLTQTLKEEMSAGIFGGAGIMDKDPNRSQLFGDLSAATEAQVHAGRLLAALSLAARHHQWAAEQLGQFSQALAASPRAPQPPSAFPPPAIGRIFPPSTRLPTPNNQQPPNPFHAFLAQNPLMAAMAAAQQHFTTATPGIPTTPSSNGAGNGIFPPAIPNGFVPSRPFGPPQIQQHQENGRHSESDGSPRKKRSKVTDSVRGPRSSLHPCREPANANSSTSERSTPQGGGAFPLTMVPLNGSQQPLLFHRNHHTEKGGSLSGDDSEGGTNMNGGGEMVQPHRTQLTHVHLRKAKLMFFYQRYPNSALLKSYFPDIHFNKHNTAQLIKWFSNFREFFYMQMEKYAKQALAEGIRHRSEVMVTQESEIFKQLNIHYNKNSIFPPPERLQFVVQETLREFFSALQQKKDAEPSWKKAIYKIIQQLDEPIPEWFKHQEFVEMLERTT